MRPADPAGNQRGLAGVPRPPAGPALVIGQHTLKVEAARAGVPAQEYLARLSQGLLYCRGCRDWHRAEAFPADGRRHSGRGELCNQAIRAAVSQDLAGRGQLPPPAAPAAVWVVQRLEPARGPGGGRARTWWRGPGPAPGWGRGRPGTWSPALDEGTARFPGDRQARDALIAAHGSPGAVPAGCRLVRLA